MPTVQTDHEVGVDEVQRKLSDWLGPSYRVAVTSSSTLKVGPRGLIGRIEIPRLGLSAVVIEGDDARTLRRAIGHMPGTPMPGHAGNIALTGHRDTFFRPLRNIREDDIVVVTTLQGEYRYRVVSTSVVSPEEIAVLNGGPGEVLTLITCYPFYFVGAAPDRFIVRAERVAERQVTRTSAQSGPGGLNL